MNVTDALAELAGGIWHTTPPERYYQIQESGCIQPEPNIPDSDRWNTGSGRVHYPIARYLGGVSLFDFTEFSTADYEEYREKYGVSCVHAFVPRQAKWSEAIWIEINQREIYENYIDGPALLKKWKDGLHGHNILPLVEAAHIGPIPLQAFRRVLRYTDAQGFSTMD